MNKRRIMIKLYTAIALILGVLTVSGCFTLGRGCCALDRELVNVAPSRLNAGESGTLFIVPNDKRFVLNDLSISTRFTSTPYQPILNYQVCIKGGVTSSSSGCTILFSYFSHNNMERAYSTGYVFPPKSKVIVTNSSNSADAIFVSFAGYLENP